MNTGLKIVLKQAGRDLVKKLRAELKAQGYFAFGNIDKSFKVRMKSDGMEILANDYAKTINYGSKPFYPNLDAIEKWVDAKGFAGNPDEKKSIARAVAKRISEEGLPHPSRGLSNNGYRLGFINRVLGSNARHIAKRVQQAALQDIMVDIKKLKKN